MLPDEIIRKMETRKVSMARLQELDSLEIGKLITNMRYGPIIKQLAMQFPAKAAPAEQASVLSSAGFTPTCTPGSHHA